MVQNMVLSQVLLLEAQVVLETEILRLVHWDMLLVQYLELYEVIMITAHMEGFLENLRDHHWDRHLVQNM